MRWMISEDRLGSDQRDVIEEIGKISDKPIWIQGYAGSGKSVLLLHSLKDYLARKPHANVCIVVFTKALVDLLKIGLTQIPFLANRVLPVLTIHHLKKNIETNSFLRYDAIFCDEVQDLPIEFINQMKGICTNLIIAGDAAQSIYTNVPSFNATPATSQEITSSIQPIEKNLSVIYRLSRSVVSILSNVFPNIINGRTVIGSVDTDIKLYSAPDFKSETLYCWNEAKEVKQLQVNSAVAILFWNNEKIINFANDILSQEGKPTWESVNYFNDPHFGLLNSHLQNNGIPLMIIGKGFGSLDEADRMNKIILMTYYSAKGLDFDYVFLPGVGTEMHINQNAPINALLLVALSRSKSGLTITFTEQLSPYFVPFLRNVPQRPLPAEGESIDDIIF